jgi:hypothetical protein
MNATTWRCEAHGTTNVGDCPRCDDELIALAPPPVCQTCKRDLLDGEEAWADDWTVIGPEGVRTETRYTCNTCVLPPEAGRTEDDA